jgi:hypothetical protein
MFQGEQEKQSNAAEFQHYKNIVVGARRLGMVMLKKLGG